MASFPSWTSPVRSRSPALSFQRLGSHSSRRYRKITALSGISVDQRRFQLLNSFNPAFETRLGVDVQVPVEGMALLISDDFRVDVLIAHKRSMGPPQHLKVDPAQTDFFQLRADVPAPYVIFR